MAAKGRVWFFWNFIREISLEVAPPLKLLGWASWLGRDRIKGADCGLQLNWEGGVPHPWGLGFFPISELSSVELHGLGLELVFLGGY